MHYRLQWVDPQSSFMHFWDPMQDRVIKIFGNALNSAAMSRAQSMTMITTIITTTRERGSG